MGRQFDPALGQGEESGVDARVVNGVVLKAIIEMIRRFESYSARSAGVVEW